MCDSAPCNQQENRTAGVGGKPTGKHTQLARQIACLMKEITSKGVLSCITLSSEVFKDALLEPATSGGEWQREGAKVTKGDLWAYRGTEN